MHGGLFVMSLAPLPMHVCIACVRFADRSVKLARIKLKSEDAALHNERRLGPCSKLGGSTSLGDLPAIFQDFPDRSTLSFMRYLEPQHAVE